MQLSHLNTRENRFLLAFGFFILVLGFLGPLVNSPLQFAREEIFSGEFWRLLTANFVHLNLYHLGLNLGGLIFVVLLFYGVMTLRYWIGAILVTCLSVSVGLLLFSPNIAYYKGFSGSLYGLFAAGMILVGERVFPKYIVYVSLAGLAIKLGYEQMPSYDVFYLREEIGGMVVVDSHFYGAIGGCFYALWERFKLWRVFLQTRKA